MNQFIAIFMQEVKRFICKKNIVLFFLVILGSMYAVHSGLNDYIINIDKANEFSMLETSTFANMTNYMLISNMGFDVFFMPAASGVLFSHPAVLSAISANINTIVTLKIYTILQSGVIFQTNPLLQFRLSSILLLLGSLLALFYGFDSLRGLEYLKFQISAASEITVFISIILSRFLLLTISFLSVLLLALGMMAIKGVHLTQSDISVLTGYLIAALVMLLFFFLLGTAIGNIRTHNIGFAVLLASWIALILMTPSFIDSIIEKKANEITSNYKIHNDKLTVVSDFERKTEKEKGAFKDNTPEGRKEVIEDYWNNYFMLVERSEERLNEEIKQVIKLSNNLYILLPSTFYLSISSEASSLGYQNFLNFYSYLQVLRRQFVRFWIDRVYYNDPKVLVNFVKGDENIFKAKSQLPPNFGQGVLLNLGYCIGLLFLSYFFYSKNMSRQENKDYPCNRVDLKIKSNQIISATKDFPGFFPQVLNIFFGKIKDFNGKISIDSENIVTPAKKDFLYLPQHEQFPGDIKTKHLIAFFKRIFKLSDDECLTLKSAAGENNLDKYFVKLKKIEKTNLLLSLVSFGKSRVYIIDDFGSGATSGERCKMMDLSLLLRDKDLIVLDFCSSGMPWMSANASMHINVSNNEYAAEIQAFGN